MDALAAIEARHSTRSYRPGVEIPRPVLEQIVNAGRLAATGRNEQPWEFVVVTSPERRKHLADLTDYGKFIADASACVVVLCRDTQYYLEDGAAATQNMLVAATALGVQSCWVSGDKRPYAQAVAQFLGAPNGYRTVALIALGYEAQTQPRRPKRSLTEVLHWEKY